LTLQAVDTAPDILQTEDKCTVVRPSISGRHCEHCLFCFVASVWPISWKILHDTFELCAGLEMPSLQQRKQWFLRAAAGALQSAGGHFFWHSHNADFYGLPYFGLFYSCTKKPYKLILEREGKK